MGRILCVVTSLALLGGCAEPVVTGPTSARPMPKLVRIENQGGIFQPSNGFSLYEEPVARSVGDVLTIQIAESLTGSNKSNTSVSKVSSLKTKSGLVKALFDKDIDASSNLSLKGSGQTDNANTMTGTLAVSVIDVLPNGNLMVGGDKRVLINDNVNILRFSGIVNRRDIKAGNVVSSSKVADARLEQVGRGVIADASTVGTMQRIFYSVLDF
ncbi:flagellar basal body L-ring protein FlgH [Andreprevotia chitinilytica]|uniref:flagellar basal body L-ring protein FlgH n=1 Tax=Andreprevotia chitinilytica TaxID=396808 RepID=UPI000558B8DE|nr:flagellar basal body L-ring protein FlgH [Andreprevotia chitinilytica]